MRFLEGLLAYGKRDVKSIAAIVKTRNATQVRTHCQKWILKIVRLVCLDIFLVLFGGDFSFSLWQTRTKGKDGKPAQPPTETDEAEELAEAARSELALYTDEYYGAPQWCPP